MTIQRTATRRKSNIWTMVQKRKQVINARPQTLAEEKVLGKIALNEDVGREGSSRCPWEKAFQA